MTPQVRVVTPVNADGTKREVLSPGSIGGLKTYKPGELTSRINMLLYGEPGIGKTQLAGSAVEVECLRPVLVLNVEDGAKTLKGRYSDSDDLTIVNPVTFGQIQRVFNDLYEKKGAGFKTVIFDNATEGQKIGIEYIFDGDKQSTDFTEFEEATWANHGWNRSAEQVRKMIRYFKSLPMNTIFISWRKDLEKDAKKPTYWGPSFSNAIATQIPGMFDSVFHYKWAMLTNEKTKKQEKTRVLQTVGGTDCIAKDRDDGNKLPAIIREPTMKKLCELWGMI